MYIEITRYKITTSESELLKASTDFQNGYLSNCEGYINRILAKADANEYIDILTWDSEENAKIAVENSMTNPIAGGYMANMDMDSIKMEHVKMLQQF
jgi:hypothetical protein